MEHRHKNIFIDELYTHFRFTAAAVLAAAVIIVVIREYFYPNGISIRGSENLFEGFFISHLFFASLTPAALFGNYKRILIPGILVAIISSSITCTLSDIVFPYIGGMLLMYDMSFHICIIEEPVLSWSFIISGALIGFFLSGFMKKVSRYTHGVHILLSSLAAGLYLITFGVSFLSLKALLFLPVLVISVLIPCVMNDVGVPSYFVSISLKPDENKKEALDSLHSEHHGHHH